MCINKNHIDILKGCTMVENYMRDYYKRSKIKKVVTIPFPIKQLQDIFEILVNKSTSYDYVLIVSCYDLRSDDTIRNNFDAYQLTVNED